MKKLLTILLMSLALNATAGTVSSYYDSLYTKGNNAYQNNEFDSALVAYQTILDAGFESPDLYYNLGNAFYKLGKVPEAILHYERALKLHPGDKDIAYNLRLSNKLISDKIEMLPESVFRKWWKTLLATFQINTWAISSIILSFISFSLLLVYLLSGRVIVKQISFFSFLLFLGISLSVYTISAASYHRLTKNNEAIVFHSSVDIQSEPSEKSTRLFVVHEGLKVTVLKQEGDWANIALPDGSEGWVLKNEIVII